MSPLDVVYSTNIVGETRFFGKKLEESEEHIYEEIHNIQVFIIHVLRFHIKLTVCFAAIAGSIREKTKMDIT